MKAGLFHVKKLSGFQNNLEAEQLFMILICL